MAHKLHKCPVCNRNVYERDMTIHHWLPKSRGGTIDETFQLCITCHSFLHYFIPIEQVHLYTTPYSLREHEMFNLYLDWIKTKRNPSKYKIKKVIDEILNYQVVV